MEKIQYCSRKTRFFLTCFTIIILLVSLFGQFDAYAVDFHYSGRLSPSDYLFGSQEQHGDSIFDHAKPIDLSATVGWGSDCGRMNFNATLQSTLDQIIKGGFFGNIGKDILPGIPMLTICYMSPTWCAILKHRQISANMLSQLRLNQCSIMDKYVDSRVEDYCQERQSCVHQAIASNGGNMDAAMESCSGY
jgi:hypothetical protein